MSNTLVNELKYLRQVHDLQEKQRVAAYWEEHKNAIFDHLRASASRGEDETDIVIENGQGKHVVAEVRRQLADLGLVTSITRLSAVTVHMPKINEQDE